jgi:hypothetical protein
VVLSAKVMGESDEIRIRCAMWRLSLEERYFSRQVVFPMIFARSSRASSVVASASVCARCGVAPRGVRRRRGFVPRSSTHVAPGGRGSARGVVSGTYGELSWEFVYRLSRMANISAVRKRSPGRQNAPRRHHLIDRGSCA